jgi:hypothetical protein
MFLSYSDLFFSMEFRSRGDNFHNHTFIWLTSHTSLHPSLSLP